MCSHPLNTNSFEEKQIFEDYKVWKKNCGFLYDLLISYALEWPSFTIQWLPHLLPAQNPNYQQQHFILGTYNKEDEEELLIGSVNIPNYSKALNEMEMEVGNFDERYRGIKIEARAKHKGLIHRARYMPQDPCLIACKGSESDVNIFHLTTETVDNSPKQILSADLVLKGHDSGGFGLSWNPNKKGFLVSGSDDSKICLWDINNGASFKSCKPVTCFTSHKGQVEDVAWHFLHETLLGSVGSDRQMMIWDTRSPSCTKPSHSIEAHLDTITSLAFSPFSEFVFATGSYDSTVALWDLRNLKLKLHTCEGHKDQVLSLEFSPHSDNLLASAGADKMLIIWDLNRIEEDVYSDDEDDGPAELIFRHSGHTGKVTDFSWNLQKPNTIISIADDNIVQIWEISKDIVDWENNCNEMGFEDNLNLLNSRFSLRDPE